MFNILATYFLLGKLELKILTRKYGYFFIVVLEL